MFAPSAVNGNALAEPFPYVRQDFLRGNLLPSSNFPDKQASRCQSKQRGCFIFFNLLMLVSCFFEYITVW